MGLCAILKVKRETIKSIHLDLLLGGSHIDLINRHDILAYRLYLYNFFMIQEF